MVLTIFFKMNLQNYNKLTIIVDFFGKMNIKDKQ